MQKQVENWLETVWVRNAILAVICFNAVILGFETSDTVMERMGTVINVLDQLCLSIFVVEILLKMFAYGPRFFRTGWNLIDFAIVGISLVPNAGALTVLRALRILRLFRVITVAPTLRRVVEGLMAALPGMGSVFLLMGLMYYIGSVIATRLFGHAFPEWFGTLHGSAYSLFQIMTLESWSMGIVRPVMEVFPYAWLFFIPFILTTSFAVVNLLVGLIVNTMQETYSEEETAATDAYREEVMQRLLAIETQLTASKDTSRS